MNIALWLEGALPKQYFDTSLALHHPWIMNGLGCKRYPYEPQDKKTKQLGDWHQILTCFLLLGDEARGVRVLAMLCRCRVELSWKDIDNLLVLRGKAFQDLFCSIFLT